MADISSRSLERQVGFIHFFISFTLCIFLILLADKFIDDLYQVSLPPNISSFVETPEYRQASEEYREVELKKVHPLDEKLQQVQKMLDLSQTNYRTEKDSFNNWLETRKALSTPDKDLEVTERAKKLDQIYAVQQEWNNELYKINQQITQAKNELDAIDKRRVSISLSAQKEFYKAQNEHELVVFLYRMLLICPLLVIGVFFFIRKRKSRYWPLFRGFSLFSLYCFFFGLVPYLPSYGGYIRYGVGIVLSVLIGYHLIKQMSAYIELRKKELSESTEERTKKIQFETADKSLENHNCPSCGKDFIQKKWDFVEDLTNHDLYKKVTDFCRYCGLQLFKKCEKCQQKNFIHLPFCASCGNKTQDKSS